MSQMEAEGDVPLCNVCKHHHRQEDKCSVCGHKGKGKIFRLLAENRVYGGLNFKYFDQRTPEPTRKGYWKLCDIIRRRVFLDELKGMPEQEFDAFDLSSRHIIIQGNRSTLLSQSRKPKRCNGGLISRRSCTSSCYLFVAVQLLTSQCSLYLRFLRDCTTQLAMPQ
jgi:hypothetical protein